jgi:hypothetical protein
MKIEIKAGKKKFLITADKRQFVLNEWRSLGKENGKPKHGWKAWRYFLTLEGLFDDLFLLKLRLGNATTLMELREEIEAAREELKSVWQSSLKAA